MLIHDAHALDRGRFDVQIADGRITPADRQIRQRVHCMVPPAAADPRFTLGPTKILLDDTREREVPVVT